MTRFPAETVSAIIEEIKQLIEDAKWDIKAGDIEDAEDKLDEAKDLAKKIRNEELLNEILKQKEKLHGEPNGV